MTLRQRRSKAKVKRATHKQDRVTGMATALAATGEAIVRRAAILATSLDANPEVRKIILARIVKAAEKAPVALLHQMAQTLEMIATE